MRTRLIAALVLLGATVLDALAQSAPPTGTIEWEDDGLDAGTIIAWPPPDRVTIIFFDGVEVTLGRDGSISYSPGYVPSEAAKQFWQAIAAGAPCKAE